MTKILYYAGASVGCAPKVCRHVPAHALLSIMASSVATMKSFFVTMNSFVATELHYLGPIPIMHVAL